MTATDITALVAHPGGCQHPLGHLPCLLAAGHDGGHIHAHESSAPDRKAG